MMSAQEIYEKEGFLIWATWYEVHEIGDVVEELRDDAVIPRGTRAVVTGTLTREEAIAWAKRNGLPAKTDQQFFYKIIAE